MEGGSQIAICLADGRGERRPDGQFEHSNLVQAVQLGEYILSKEGVHMKVGQSWSPMACLRYEPSRDGRGP